MAAQTTPALLVRGEVVSSEMSVATNCSVSREARFHWKPTVIWAGMGGMQGVEITGALFEITVVRVNSSDELWNNGSV